MHWMCGPLVRRVSKVATAIWLILGVLCLAACVTITINNDESYSDDKEGLNIEKEAEDDNPTVPS